MALANGVLVHGPRYWACAVRLDDGGLEVASGLKPFRAAEIENRFIRGPARMAEIFALLPEIRRRLPAAQLPFQRPAVAAAMVGSAAAVRLVRGSKLSSAAQEILAAALAVGPAAVAMRGSNLAEYHGAEHISIGTYEHGEERAKEHERCGSHLIGPLLAASAAGNILASRAPAHLRRPARVASSIGAVGAAVEVFAWMTRHPGHPLAKALARPGHELQHRIATAEPSPEQLEVANLALDECVRLESAANGGNRTAEEAPPT